MDSSTEFAVLSHQMNKFYMPYGTTSLFIWTPLFWWWRSSWSHERTMKVYGPDDDGAKEWCCLCSTSYTESILPRVEKIYTRRIIWWCYIGEEWVGSQRLYGGIEHGILYDNGHIVCGVLYGVYSFSELLQQRLVWVVELYILPLLIHLELPESNKRSSYTLIRLLCHKSPW